MAAYSAPMECGNFNLDKEQILAEQTQDEHFSVKRRSLLADDRLLAKWGQLCCTRRRYRQTFDDFVYETPGGWKERHSNILKTLGFKPYPITDVHPLYDVNKETGRATGRVWVLEGGPSRRSGQVVFKQTSKFAHKDKVLSRSSWELSEMFAVEVRTQLYFCMKQEADASMSQESDRDGAPKGETTTIASVAGKGRGRPQTSQKKSEPDRGYGKEKTHSLENKTKTLQTQAVEDRGSTKNAQDKTAAVPGHEKMKILQNKAKSSQNPATADQAQDKTKTAQKTTIGNREQGGTVRSQTKAATDYAHDKTEVLREQIKILQKKTTADAGQKKTKTLQSKLSTTDDPNKAKTLNSGSAADHSQDKRKVLKNKTETSKDKTPAIQDEETAQLLQITKILNPNRPAANRGSDNTKILQSKTVTDNDKHKGKDMEKLSAIQGEDVGRLLQIEKILNSKKPSSVKPRGTKPAAKTKKMPQTRVPPHFGVIASGRHRSDDKDEESKDSVQQAQVQSETTICKSSKQSHTLPSPTRSLERERAEGDNACGQNVQEGNQTGKKLCTGSLSSKQSNSRNEADAQHGEKGGTDTSTYCPDTSVESTSSADSRLSSIPDTGSLPPSSQIFSQPQSQLRTGSQLHHVTQNCDTPLSNSLLRPPPQQIDHQRHSTPVNNTQRPCWETGSQNNFAREKNSQYHPGRHSHSQNPQNCGQNCPYVSRRDYQSYSQHGLAPQNFHQQYPANYCQHHHLPRGSLLTHPNRPGYRPQYTTCPNPSVDRTYSQHQRGVHDFPEHYRTSSSQSYSGQHWVPRGYVHHRQDPAKNYEHPSAPQTYLRTRYHKQTHDSAQNGPQQERAHNKHRRRNKKGGVPPCADPQKQDSATKDSQNENKPLSSFKNKFVMWTPNGSIIPPGTFVPAPPRSGVATKPVPPKSVFKVFMTPDFSNTAAAPSDDSQTSSAALETPSAALASIKEYDSPSSMSSAADGDHNTNVESSASVLTGSANEKFLSGEESRSDSNTEDIDISQAETTEVDRRAHGARLSTSEVTANVSNDSSVDVNSGISSANQFPFVNNSSDTEIVRADSVVSSASGVTKLSSLLEESLMPAETAERSSTVSDGIRNFSISPRDVSKTSSVATNDSSCAAETLTSEVDLSTQSVDLSSSCASEMCPVTPSLHSSDLSLCERINSYFAEVRPAVNMGISSRGSCVVGARLSSSDFDTGSSSYHADVSCPSSAVCSPVSASAETNPASSGSGSESFSLNKPHDHKEALSVKEVKPSVQRATSLRVVHSDSRCLSSSSEEVAVLMASGDSHTESTRFARETCLPRTSIIRDNTQNSDGVRARLLPSENSAFSMVCYRSSSGSDTGSSCLAAKRVAPLSIRSVELITSGINVREPKLNTKSDEHEHRRHGPEANYALPCSATTGRINPITSGAGTNSESSTMKQALYAQSVQGDSQGSSTNCTPLSSSEISESRFAVPSTGLSGSSRGSDFFTGITSDKANMILESTRILSSARSNTSSARSVYASCVSELPSEEVSSSPGRGEGTTTSDSYILSTTELEFRAALRENSLGMHDDVFEDSGVTHSSAEAPKTYSESSTGAVDDSHGAGSESPADVQQNIVQTLDAVERGLRENVRLTVPRDAARSDHFSVTFDKAASVRRTDAALSKVTEGTDIACLPVVDQTQLYPRTETHFSKVTTEAKQFCYRMDTPELYQTETRSSSRLSRASLFSVSDLTVHFPTLRPEKEHLRFPESTPVPCPRENVHIARGSRSSVPSVSDLKVHSPALRSEKGRMRSASVHKENRPSARNSRSSLPSVSDLKVHSPTHSAQSSYAIATGMDSHGFYYRTSEEQTSSMTKIQPYTYNVLPVENIGRVNQSGIIMYDTDSPSFDGSVGRVNFTDGSLFHEICQDCAETDSSGLSEIPLTDHSAPAAVAEDEDGADSGFLGTLMKKLKFYRPWF